MSVRSSAVRVLIALVAATGIVAPYRAARRSAVEAPSVVVVPAPALPSDGPPADSIKKPTGSTLICEYAAAGAADATCPDTLSVTHALVVVIPDPIESHLDWAFDSGIESVRRAFEHARFVLDRYWLPWLDPDSARRAAAGLKPLRATMPGVMVFRSRDTSRVTLAVAYLVGESPTIGIHTAAFRAALEDRKIVMRRWPVRTPTVLRDTLRIVGPVFSGSARSTRDALDAWFANDKDTAAVLVLSGGATASDNALTIRRCVPGALGFVAGQRCAGPRIRFHATVNSVDLLKLRMETVLAEQFDITRSQIAYLTESGTQYGRSLIEEAERSDEHLTQPDTLPLELPFPLNISRLRQEYARQIVPAESLARGQNVSRTRLDWRDPASSVESPAAISELTAPMIERTLSDIQQTLLLHRIRAVGILATDIRDRLFVASVVKEHLRDIQLFFLGSHVLYLRPELNERLRGSLVVSTYPLFLENQFWDLTHNWERQRLVFTSDQSEGIYNATLAQLGYMKDLTDYAYPMEHDSASPAILGPPVWLTVIGTNSMLPVIAKANTARLAHRETSYVFVRDEPGPLRPLAEVRPGSLEQSLITTGVLLVLLLAVSLHVSWLLSALRVIWDRTARLLGIMYISEKKQPRRTPTPYHTTVRAMTRLRWRREQLALLFHRESWIVFRFVAVVCALAPVCLVLFRPREHGSARSQAGLLFIIVAVVAAILLVGVASWREIRGASLTGDGEQQKAGAEKPPDAPAGATAELPRLRQRLAKRGRRGLRLAGVALPCLLLLLIAGVYLLLTGYFTLRVSTFADGIAGMFFLRTLQLNSGVTSAVPLFLGGLLLVLWSSWHLKRVGLLGEVSAFEVACSDERIDASAVAPSGWRTRPTSHPPVIRLLGVRPRGPLGSAAELRECVRFVRDGLIALVPRWDALALLLVFLLLAPWVIQQATRSIDTAILEPFSRVRDWPSTFDLLFRFLVFAAIGLTAWSLYRLIAVWSALRDCLRNIDALPLGEAFERLPPAIASVARFTPVSAPSSSVVSLTIDRVAHARWLELRCLEKELPSKVKEFLPAPPRQTFPGMRSEDGAFDVAIADPLIAMHESLCEESKRDDVYLRSMVVEGKRPTPTKATGEGGAGTGAPKAEPPRGAVTVMQELVALYVIDYVESVVRHLRHLALSLIICLTITTVMLSSYPFTPASVVRVGFFTLMALAVAAIATTLFQMNRNATLSRISHTAAGEVTWDTQFIINLLLVTGVPLLTVISAQFPGVREFLFSWLSPALIAIGKS